MKHISKIIVSLIIILSFFSQLSVCTASTLIADAATLVFEDDFSTEKSYSAKIAEYTQEYGIGNPAPAVYLKKSDGYSPRLTQNCSPLRSNGVYVVQFDFMKPSTEDCSAFMEITNQNGGKDAFYLRISDGKMVMCCWDLNGNSQTVTLANDFVANKWYNITLSVNIDKKTVKTYIDGWRVARGTVCAFNPEVTSIGRFIDSRCNSEYYLDNILVYRDLIAEELDFDDVINPTENIELPLVGKSGGSIVWTSSNTEILSNSGELIDKPSYTTNVELTATIIKGTVTQNRDFIVRIEGSEHTVVSTDIIIKEVSRTATDILPATVTATLDDGSTISLLVEWKENIDTNIIDEPQEIFGIVSGGASTALARITLLGSFKICRINYSDENDNPVLRMVNRGKINSVLLYNGSNDLNANLVVSIIDEKGAVAESVTVELASVADWEVGTIKKVPVNYTFSVNDADEYTVKAEVVGVDGNPACPSFESRESVPARIYIAGDSTAATTVNSYEAGSKDTCGWADVLSEFFDSSIKCCNFTNTRQPITGYASMDTILKTASEDDYIIFNFGHTNSNLIREVYYPSADEFENKLRSFIDTVCLKSITPIIATPYMSQNSIIGVQQQYCDVVKSIASEYDLPLFDFETIIPEHLASLEYDGFTDSTNTYLTRAGAAQVAGLVTQLIDKLEAPAEMYMRYDVVTCFASGEDTTDYSYDIISMRYLDADGKVTDKLVKGGKIDKANIKSLLSTPENANLYVAVFHDKKVKFLKGAKLPDGITWLRNDNKEIDVDITLDLQDIPPEECSVRVFIFNEQLSPCCDTYDMFN